MFGMLHAKGPAILGAGAPAPKNAVGVVVALAIIAALAQLAIQASSSDALYLTRWLVAMAFALPGLLLTRDMTLLDLEQFKRGKLSKFEFFKLTMYFIAAFVLFVIAIPAVLELWFWA